MKRAIGAASIGISAHRFDAEADLEEFRSFLDEALGRD